MVRHVEQQQPLWHLELTLLTSMAVLTLFPYFTMDPLAHISGAFSNDIAYKVTTKSSHET